MSYVQPIKFAVFLSFAVLVTFVCARPTFLLPNWYGRFDGVNYRPYFSHSLYQKRQKTSTIQSRPQGYVGVAMVAAEINPIACGRQRDGPHNWTQLGGTRGLIIGLTDVRRGEGFSMQCSDFRPRLHRGSIDDYCQAKCLQSEYRAYSSIK